MTPSPQRPGRRAILRVLWGSMACQQALLQPGQVLRVGRAPSEGLAVPDDEALSDTHFELSWDGRQCRLKDLRSRTGTLLGGQPVREAEVLNAGWIRAGRTDLSVHFERWTRWEPGEPKPPEALALEDRALEVLREQRTHLYALVDLARDERLRELLWESVEEFRSLYEGAQGERTQDVAPYLVELPERSELLEVLVREGWGRGWGMFLASAQPLPEVRRHLRKLLMVKLESLPERVYFRFYDPRVLREFLQVCTPEQRQVLFGSTVECFLFEGTGGEVSRVVPEETSPSPPRAQRSAPAIGDAALQLTATQVGHMDALAREKFQAKLGTFLREVAPRQVDLLGTRLGPFIARQAVQATRLGLRTEQSIAKWVLLALLTGERFQAECSARELKEPGQLLEAMNHSLDSRGAEHE